MRIIDHHQFERKAKHPRRWLRYSLIGVGIVAGLFILSNIVVGVAYRGKVLPNYRLGSAEVGGTSFTELNKRLNANTLLPRSVTLKAAGRETTVTPADIGMH